MTVPMEPIPIALDLLIALFVLLVTPRMQEPALSPTVLPVRQVNIRIWGRILTHLGSAMNARRARTPPLLELLLAISVTPLKARAMAL